MTFKEELTSLINKHSLEGVSNTPDSILATYLLTCLYAFDEATRKRTAWYGQKCDEEAAKVSGLNIQTQVMREALAEDRYVTFFRDDKGLYHGMEYVNYRSAPEEKKYLPTCSDTRGWKDAETAVAEFKKVLDQASLVEKLRAEKKRWGKWAAKNVRRFHRKYKQRVADVCQLERERCIAAIQAEWDKHGMLTDASVAVGFGVAIKAIKRLGGK